MKPRAWCLLAALWCGLVAAQGEPWPTRPVQLLVAHGVGGTTDALARDLARRLEQRWGQPVVVDNRPSAGGMLATQATVSAPADGYHLLVQNSALVLGEVLLQDRRSTPLFRQLRPLTLLATAPNVWVTRGARGTVSARDWLRQTQKETMDVASCGNGKAQHFVLMQLHAQHGLKLNHIPYNTCTQAVMGVLSGSVRSALVSPEAVLPLLRAGELQALAVTSIERMAALPEVPSLHESGVAGLDAVTWYGVLAPAGLSAELARRIARDIQAVMSSSVGRTDQPWQVSLRDGAAFGQVLEQEYNQLLRLDAAQR